MDFLNLEVVKEPFYFPARSSIIPKNLGAPHKGRKGILLNDMFSRNWFPKSLPSTDRL